MGHTTASRDGSPKPPHSNPSINDSDKVPSLVRRTFGSRVCIASLKAGTNPPPDLLRSNRCGVAGCPSGIPRVPSRTQYLKDWEVSEHCDILYLPDRRPRSTGLRKGYPRYCQIKHEVAEAKMSTPTWREPSLAPLLRVFVMLGSYEFAE